jgi:uncharacterized protein YbaR (Trm112 family)
MHTKILKIICCSFDQGELIIVNNANVKDSVIKEGLLECCKCKKKFEVIQGIPIIRDRQDKTESAWRDNIYVALEGGSYETLIKHVIKHHYVVSMSREARYFCKRFKDHDFILDLGSGWCWPWHNILGPNIICIDFSMEALIKATRMIPEQIDQNVHLICADFLKIPLRDRSLKGVWSSRAIYIRDDNHEAVNRIIVNLKNKLQSNNLFFVFDNYPFIIKFIYSIFGKKISAEMRFGELFAKRISPLDLPEEFFTFKGKSSIRYNEMVYNHELRLVHNFNLACLDYWLGKIPFINRGIGRQLIFELYE